MRPLLRTPVRGYAIAIAATGVCLYLWLALTAALGSQVPLMIFILGVMIATRYGGRGPGLLAIGLSVLAVVVVARFQYEVQLIRFPDVIRLVLFFVVGLLVTWTIEALHAAHQQRQTSEERFRLLVEGVRDYALFMTDTEGRIVSWNPGAERLLGYREGEIVGRPFACIFTPEDIADGAPEREMSEAQEKGRASDERWHVRKDGTRFFATGVVHPLRAPSGAPRGFAKVLQDVTERQRMQHVLQGRAAALTSMLHALMAQPELGDFLGRVLAAVADLLRSQAVSLWLTPEGSEECCSLELTFDDGRILRKGREGCSTLPDDRLSEEVPLWKRMLETRKPVIVGDVGGDPQVTNREWLLARGVRTLVLVPMLMDERVVGALSICRAETRPWEPGEIELAQALAQQAMLALEMTRLAEQGQKAAVLEERNRMAREIHDTLAQGFTGIVLQLTAAEHELTASPDKAQAHLIRARDLARESLAAARRSVWALHPRSLEDSTLPEALKRHMERMTEGTSIKTDLRVQGRPRPLPPEIESNVLRVGMEALTNALKHAKASAIHTEIDFEPGQVRLSVQDDGVGFDPQSTASGEGFGLLGMRERAERIGGRVAVASRPREGARIDLVVPTPIEESRGDEA